MHIPYTYLIGWAKQNKYYYGVRYAKLCHPSDLFVSYFTSSKLVKIYIEKFGYPDIIQIRKIFTDPMKAILWEQKLIRRMKLHKNNKWLNQSVPGTWDTKHRKYNYVHMFGGNVQRKLAYKRIAAGTHNLNEYNKIAAECPHCKKVGQPAAMKRWHYNNCNSA